VRYAFYPGCSLESSASEYRISTEKIAAALGIELDEIPEWICCGSTPAHMTGEILSLALPAYNLVLASRMKTEGVIVSCASCYSRLKHANFILKNDPRKQDLVAEVLGERYDGSVPVFHLLEVVVDLIDKPTFGELIKVDLGELKVASYYGCLLVRPPEVTDFDDPEDPQIMDRIVEALGAQTVAYNYKVECCGAALAFPQVEIVRKLSGDILQDAKDSGADIILVACPLCHSNLDMRQREIEKYLGVDLEIPVLYFTQLMGLAFGFGPGELGLEKHVIDVAPVLKRLRIRV